MLRRGFALPIALGALAIVAALVATAFLASLEELRTARALRFEVEALALAESDLTSLLTAWDSTWSSSAPGLASVQVRTSGAAVDTVRVAHLTARVFLVSATAHAGVEPRSARRRIALLVGVDSLGRASPLGARSWNEVF